MPGAALLRPAKPNHLGWQRYDVPGHPNLYVEGQYDDPDEIADGVLARRPRLYAWVVFDERFGRTPWIRSMRGERLGMPFTGEKLADVREWLKGSGPALHEQAVQRHRALTARVEREG